MTIMYKYIYVCVYEYKHKLLYYYVFSYCIILYLSLPHTQAEGGNSESWGSQEIFNVQPQHKKY